MSFLHFYQLLLVTVERHCSDLSYKKENTMLPGMRRGNFVIASDKLFKTAGFDFWATGHSPLSYM